MPDYPALATLYGSLSGTLDQRLATINAMTVTGSIPTAFAVSGAQIMNCLDVTEFNSLTTAKQTIVLQICALPTVIGGSSSFVGKLFANYYSTMLAGPTIAALTALAQATIQPWWQAHGFYHAIDYGDVKTAGAVP